MLFEEFIATLLSDNNIGHFNKNNNTGNIYIFELPEQITDGYDYILAIRKTGGFSNNTLLKYSRTIISVYMVVNDYELGMREYDKIVKLLSGVKVKMDDKHYVERIQQVSDYYCYDRNSNGDYLILCDFLITTSYK